MRLFEVNTNTAPSSPIIDIKYGDEQSPHEDLPTLHDVD
jgi:hypothetical protein